MVSPSNSFAHGQFMLTYPWDNHTINQLWFYYVIHRPCPEFLQTLDSKINIHLLLCNPQPVNIQSPHSIRLPTSNKRAARKLWPATSPVNPQPATCKPAARTCKGRTPLNQLSIGACVLLRMFEARFEAFWTPFRIFSNIQSVGNFLKFNICLNVGVVFR